MRRTKAIFGFLLVAGLLLLGGCANQIEKPVQSDRVEGAPETPRNLQTLVDNGSIVLSWNISDQSKILRFLIYRGDTTKGGPVLVDSTTELTYFDRKLRNGLRYVYQVSTIGKNSLESKLSSPASATPNIFSVVIANGAKYTNTSDVTLSLAAPNGTYIVLLSNDSLFTGANWTAFAATKNWKLELQDGVRYVYAQFRDGEGNEVSRSVWDDVIVDTKARILSVAESSSGTTLTAGDTLRFILNTGEGGGVATVDLPTVGTINLSEDLSSGADGSYYVDYVVPAGIDVVNATVTGSFTDAAGNRAQSRVATSFVNIANPPAAVIATAFPVSETEVEIDWTPSGATDFAGYRIFRDTLANVDTLSVLAQNQSIISTASFKDTNRKPGTDYYYVIYTVDKTGLKSRSNVVKATTLANTPPKAVTIFITKQDSTSITLGWTLNSDTDFESYRVYRSDTLSTDTADAELTGVVTTQNTIQFTDNNIHKKEMFDFFVRVFDKYGLASAISNKERGPKP